MEIHGSQIYILNTSNGFFGKKIRWKRLVSHPIRHSPTKKTRAQLNRQQFQPIAQNEISKQIKEYELKKSASSLKNPENETKKLKELPEETNKERKSEIKNINEKALKKAFEEEKR